MKINIDYDGAWPNLCSGTLIVTVDNIVYNFGNHCMSSGGSVGFSSDWSDEFIDYGDWRVEFPEDFPEDLKNPVLDAINNEVQSGCCGGCL